MNIFVAKLSSGTTSEDLNELFAGYGTVDSAKVIFDRETGNSKRFGFVEMSNDDEAHAAIDGLDGSDFDNSKIVVKKAKPRTESNNQRRPNNGYNRRY
ncbi:MAG: RNA-binding protein [Bacteroidales bacterium]|nr:RNA-binding protein [Bacteroidales bacterium]